MIWHRNVNMLNLILSFMWYDFPKMIFLLFCFIPGQRTVIFQGSTFPAAQGHMPLDFAVGP